jgi:hypothetical protein
MDAIKARFPLANVLAYRAGALNSFYAERGGLIMGFETGKGLRA